MLTHRPRRYSTAPLLLASAAASAQSCFSWSQVSTVNSPPDRYQPCMAYDSDRGILMVHGGTGDSGAGFLADTWEFDGILWTQRGDGAIAFSGNSMAYDRRRHRMVVASNDFHLYEFDVPTGQWVQSIMFPGAPLSAARMAFDEARGVMVIVLSNGTMYTWDGGPSPVALSTPFAPRIAFGLAYDSDRQRTVLTGGNDGTNNLTDTWEWDGATWTQKATIGPALRQVPNHTVYDRSRHRIVAMEQLSSATWDWDGALWTKIDNTGPTPTRGAFAFAYDESRAQSFLFGGSGNPNYNDFWTATSPGPIFSIQPLSTGVVQGSDVTLAVQCASQVHSLQWRKNGTPIPGATSPILSIPAAATTAAGAYDVVAAGECNSTATSNPATLAVWCYPNCDHSTTAPTLNVNDFICFLNKFSAGCP